MGSNRKLNQRQAEDAAFKCAQEIRIISHGTQDSPQTAIMHIDYHKGLKRIILGQDCDEIFKIIVLQGLLVYFKGGKVILVLVDLYGIVLKIFPNLLYKTMIIKS